MVNSCQNCDQCSTGEEQFCRQGATLTYGSPDRSSGEITQGGYSTNIVVREEFVLNLPAQAELSRVAPLLCAGITVYSLLKSLGVTKNSRVGVVGLGGIGHMAVRIAVAMGAEVTVISRNNSKAAEAKALGAVGLLSVSDEQAFQKALSSFDVIIDTIPVKHSIQPYISLLDVSGTLVILGQMGPLDDLSGGGLIMGCKKVIGSLIGGIQETQECIDFCIEQGVYPECEFISIEKINEACERLSRGDLANRIVIDMSFA